MTGRREHCQAANASEKHEAIGMGSGMWRPGSQIVRLQCLQSSHGKLAGARASTHRSKAELSQGQLRVEPCKQTQRRVRCCAACTTRGSRPERTWRHKLAWFDPLGKTSVTGRLPSVPFENFPVTVHSWNGRNIASICYGSTAAFL